MGKITTCPKKKLAIIVPAFNEEKVVFATLKSIPRSYPSIDEVQITVVDDGSRDNTSKEAERHPDVLVLRHVINRGLGGALSTGMKWAQGWGADFAVTFDADGQLDPLDIQKVLEPLLKEEADVAIGSRLLKIDGMPWYRIIGNWGLNVVTYVLYGMLTTDSQSGLRAFSAKALNLIRIRSSRMEVSSEIIGEITRNKLRLAEVPISCAYTEYSLAKGQRNLNGINIVLNLLLRKVTSSK